MSENKNVLFENQEGIGIITINRPKALNALNIDVFNELSPLLDEIAKDNSIRVVIITGSGEKSFVAGADITYMLPMSSPEGKAWGEVGQGVFNKIEKLPQPVIAAINGFALGGGCELAMACDIRIASEKAKFGQPEVGLGIIPGFAGTQRLPRLVGKGRAKELLFTGDMIDAHEAYRIGLVNKVVSPEELMDAAKGMAKKIMKHAPYAVQLCKEAVNVGMEVDLETGSKYEGALFGVTCATEDKKEGMTAFVEKRKPNFTGK
ncbi:MAG: enoyl-CoA hydratase [Clostridia bacterium]|jgi:enoyl-CoA hydratase|nr:enoyl-CoA hydratase [Clostridia bacterium]